MKLILTKDVKKVGKKDDVVDVSEGYARNFLLRNKLAEVVTDTALRQIKDTRKRNESKAQSEARELAGQLNKLTSQVYHFTLPGDKNGHLYAGLKESEILAKLGQGRPPAASHLSLHDYSPLKSLGEHEVNVKISSLNKIRKIKIIIESMT